MPDLRSFGTATAVNFGPGGKRTFGTPLTFASVSRTDVGKVRRINEDAVFENSGKAVWAIADGVGGHQAGDYASAELMAALTSYSESSGGDLRGGLRTLRGRIEDVHQHLRDVADERGGDTIASTVVVLLMSDQQYLCGWSGDSRLYLFRGGRLKQVTHDHSFVQTLVDQGQITAEEAERHPRANVLTAAIGARADFQFDVVEGRPEPGDLFLLCTDGLTRMVPLSVIEQLLGGGELNEIADQLIGRALDAGGKDNVSVVLVRCT